MILNDSWIYFLLGAERTENDSSHQIHLSVDDGKHVLPFFSTCSPVQKLNILLKFRDTHFTIIEKDLKSESFFQFPRVHHQLLLFPTQSR